MCWRGGCKGMAISDDAGFRGSETGGLGDEASCEDGGW